MQKQMRKIPRQCHNQQKQFKITPLLESTMNSKAHKR